MKFKKLKIISSILGVFAVCGLFGLSLLGNNKSEVRADDLVLSSVVDSNDVIYTSNGIDRVDDGDISLGYGRMSLGSTNQLGYWYNAELLQMNEGLNVFYRVRYKVSIGYIYSSSTSKTIYPQGYYTFYTPYFTTLLNNLTLKLYSINIDIGDSFYADNSNYMIFDVLDGSNVSLSPLGTYQWSFNYSYSDVMSYDDLYFGYSYNPRPFNNTGLNPDELNYAQFIQFSTASFVLGENDYANGYNYGYSVGVSEGSILGYSQGYNDGFYDASNPGESVIQQSYNDGYSQGYSDALGSNQTVATIFSGILQVGMLPINFFLAIFNFEILGINIASFISALMTIAVTIIVVRIVLGGKNG